MNIRKTTALAATLALLATVAAAATPATARQTREFLNGFGSIPHPAGVAVDLETGNVYVASDERITRGNKIYVYGPDGGSPAGGAPSEIAGLELAGEDEGEPAGIAIDNSCYEHIPRLTGKACEEYDPSYGDLYTASGGYLKIVQKFKLDPGHGYELVENGPSDNGEAGIMVDSHGDLFLVYTDQGGHGPIVEYKKIVEKVVNGQTKEEEVIEHYEEITIPEGITTEAAYIAADERGHIYVSAYGEEAGNARFRGVGKLGVEEDGNVLSEEVLTPPLPAVNFRPVAVDRSTGTVFVGGGPEVEEFSSAGALQLTFGSEEALGGSIGKGNTGVSGIAVDGERGFIYVLNKRESDVDVFGSVESSPVIEGAQPPVSDVARTSALVAGTATPEGKQSDYYFQYVTAAGYEAGAAEPYAAGGRTAVQLLAGGNTPVTVERVALTGLSPGTTYHYRMVVINAAGTAFGPDETFTTAPATPPAATTGGALAVAATSVTLTGAVDPRGLPTSYVFEVGADTGYTGARLFGNAGSSTGEVAVSVGVQYLVPGTTYHYRLSATSFDGTSYGQDGTFTTPAVVASIAQPASEPLIASAGLQFPSIAGAITHALGKSGHRGKPSAGARRRRALRACARERSRKLRSRCEARARKTR